MPPSRPFLLRVPDTVFLIVLGMVLLGGRTGLLNDPGTFWHLRLGREIAQSGAVPRSDTLTYSRGNTPWVDQSWAFDLGLAAIVDRAGWSGAIAAASIGLAVVYGMLASGLVRSGVSPLTAVAVSILAAGIGSIHFLIRPHLVTFAFVLWTLRACQAQHERGGWAIGTVPPLMVAWANLHGGFLAGPLIVLTAGFGHAISGAWDERRQRELVPFAAAFVASCLAPLVNPYGFGLYRHVGHLLVSSGVTEIIAEYQPISFGKAEFRLAEWVVLALIALPAFSRTRMSRYDVLHTLVWLHFALGSVRQTPLFALAAAPGLARLLDGVLSESPERLCWSPTWSRWPALVSLALGLAVAAGATLGGPDPAKWPLGAVAALNRQPVDARLFHEQDWGGMIEAECRPARPAYLDDRFELFGKKAVLDYLAALQGGPQWDELSDREGFDLVWLRPDRGLTRRLSTDPKWQQIHRDPVSVLFRRKTSMGARRFELRTSPLSGVRSSQLSYAPMCRQGEFVF
jgi:hypothetical protein